MLAVEIGRVEMVLLSGGGWCSENYPPQIPVCFHWPPLAFCQAVRTWGAHTEQVISTEKGGQRICFPHLLPYALISTLCLMAVVLRETWSLQRFNYVQHAAKRAWKIEVGCKDKCHLQYSLSLSLSLCVCLSECVSAWFCGVYLCVGGCVCVCACLRASSPLPEL